MGVALAWAVSHFEAKTHQHEHEGHVPAAQVEVIDPLEYDSHTPAVWVDEHEGHGEETPDH